MITKFITLALIPLVLGFKIGVSQINPWYHHTTIYQVYPRSFYDTNNDGIGDIKGIIEKLDYIQGLGFETIWCSPFFESPQSDFGYDISNYRMIAPEYGSINDVETLISEVHKRGMRIVFDMVMNHTSIQHQWFKQDEAKGKKDKNDFYIWKDKPNNWKSMTGGSGWHYSEKRKQYYWASFLPFQPDLNYRNPIVKNEMLNNVRFWLQKGVDGFRLDIFNVIYKDSSYKNNPFSLKIIPTETNPNGFFQQMKYTINQPENILFARELRTVCDESGDKILLGEVSGNRNVIRKFSGEEENNGLGLVFNFEMLRFKFRAKYFYKLVKNIEKTFHSPFMPVYTFSNHDRRRSIKRLKDDIQKARLLHWFQFTVRGVPCLYYGEEIGMTDARIPFKNGLDPIAKKMKKTPRFLFDMVGETANRDELRTPMQWNNTKNAGFSSALKTWLPVNPNYQHINVLDESKNPFSILNNLKDIIELRNISNSMRYGDISLLDKDALPENVIGYNRKFGNEETLILLNFSKKPVDFYIYNGIRLINKLNQEDNIKNNIIHLSPYGGIIFLN